MEKLKVELWESPKEATIIEGFPGFGMVGTIASEAIIDHLKPKLIGRIISNRLPALVAIHKGKLVEPLGIFYDPKHNIIIQHAVTNITGLEWELSDAVIEIAKTIKSREIICLEGIGTFSLRAAAKASKIKELTTKTHFYTNNSEARKKFELMGLQQLNEGIVVGVTGMLILKAYDKMKISCIFGETYSGLPDSRAAASIINVIDRYLGLKIPYEPLLKKAEEFEKKLQQLFVKAKAATEEKEKKEEKLGYIA